MIKHKQTILAGDPQGRQGNCWQTAIASILDLPVEDVPHFVQIDEDGGTNWWLGTWNFINDLGYDFVVLRGHPDTDEHYLVSGLSPRGIDLHHVVIYQHGMMVHDPHPDDTGVLEEKSFETIRKRA